MRMLDIVLDTKDIRTIYLPPRSGHGDGEEEEYIFKIHRLLY